MLNRLPGQWKDTKKHFFTSTYTALRMRVDTLAQRAQRDKPFTHPFSPHCLRHTFAIQHINVGTDVKLISKWLGHESVAVTLAHYGNWIKETQRLAEDVSRDANAKMMAKVAALPKRFNTGGITRSMAVTIPMCEDVRPEEDRQLVPASPESSAEPSRPSVWLRFVPQIAATSEGRTGSERRAGDRHVLDF